MSTWKDILEREVVSEIRADKAPLYIAHLTRPTPELMQSVPTGALAKIPPDSWKLTDKVLSDPAYTPAVLRLLGVPGYIRIEKSMRWWHTHPLPVPLVSALFEHWIDFFKTRYTSDYDLWLPLEHAAQILADPQNLVRAKEALENKNPQTPWTSKLYLTPLATLWPTELPELGDHLHMLIERVGGWGKASEDMRTSVLPLLSYDEALAKEALDELLAKKLTLDFFNNEPSSIPLFRGLLNIYTAHPALRPLVTRLIDDNWSLFSHTTFPGETWSAARKEALPLYEHILATHFGNRAGAFLYTNTYSAYSEELILRALRAGNNTSPSPTAPLLSKGEENNIWDRFATIDPQKNLLSFVLAHVQDRTRWLKWVSHVQGPSSPPSLTP